jgi:hypothetical protein
MTVLQSFPTIHKVYVANFANNEDIIHGNYPDPVVGLVSIRLTFVWMRRPRHASFLIILVFT